MWVLGFVVPENLQLSCGPQTSETESILRQVPMDSTSGL